MVPIRAMVEASRKKRKVWKNRVFLFFLERCPLLEELRNEDIVAEKTGIPKITQNSIGIPMASAKW